MATSFPLRSAKGPPLHVAAFIMTALLLAWTCFTPTRLTAQSAPASAASQEQSPAASDRAIDLSDEVVRDVLSNFQRSIETRNLERLLETFDAEATPDYPRIRDQFVAFFRLHDNIKFRYQLLQSTADKDVAFATADVDMDAQPADDLPTEQRRTAQMHFQMKRAAKGWRLTGLKPMDFFTQ
ncbi:MAG TPA: hypothetical protein VE779_17220 [Candidatus Angelobacter sp.]|nr:hypothetical protein [Candidatus Angelobacter sp.]